MLSYLRRIEDITDEVKLNILVSLLDTSVCMYTADCPTFEAAIARLDEVYVKPINEVFARHKLNTCRQEMSESLEYFQRLKKLSADCNFTAVSAVQSRNASIRDAFIAGLCSSHIRQRLLEDNVTELQAAFDKARSLDDAQSYTSASVAVSANHSLAVNLTGSDQHTFVNQPECLATKTQLCFFCGARRHPRRNCPKTCVCHKCGKKGHFARVRRSLQRPLQQSRAAPIEDFDGDLQLATLRPFLESDDEKVNVYVFIHGVLAKGLIDTGAKSNHIALSFIRRAQLTVQTSNKVEKVILAVKGSAVATKAFAQLKFNSVIVLMMM